MQRDYVKWRIFLEGNTILDGFFPLLFSIIPAQPYNPSYREQGSITCE